MSMEIKEYLQEPVCWSVNSPRIGNLLEAEDMTFDPWVNKGLNSPEQGEELTILTSCLRSVALT